MADKQSGKLGKALTQYFRTSSQIIGQTEVHLEVALAANNSSDINEIIKRADQISDNLLQIRVFAHNAKTKEAYSKESIADARKELQELSGVVEAAGTEADKLTSIRSIFEAYPYSATVLLAFLIERPELAERAWNELNSDERQTWRRVIREVDRDTVNLDGK